MSLFDIFLAYGFDHIADIQAYDHMVFIMALCAIYSISEWRSILVLVTAFTIGHTLSLALATLDIVNLNSKLVETLIPITILITALFNILKPAKKLTKQQLYTKFGIVLFFGIIHGLGFSGYLGDLIGREGNITIPLLAFNIGLELGQLLIVAIILVISTLFLKVLHVKAHEWNHFVSGMSFGMGLLILLNVLYS